MKNLGRIRLIISRCSSCDAVSADVDQALRAVVVDHFGVAPVEVVDHAVDGLLVARDDARAQHYGVAGIDVRVLVVIHRRARERPHRLALRAGDHDQHLVRRAYRGSARG